jgi:hypothetical protein
MILYTLVHSDFNEGKTKHKIIGSTFESDTAIFLYFSNEAIKDEIYFVFTEMDFDLVKKQSHLDLTLEFFPDLDDNKIVGLNLYKKDSIFKLQSTYFSDMNFCLSSIEEEIKYTTLITKYEDQKSYLLKNDYEDQDNRVFSSEKEMEILYVSLLNYSINGELNTIIAGSSYHSNICALLLHEKIEELKADWCSFYIKTMFIFKSDINDFLTDNKIKFQLTSEDPLHNAMLSPISNDEDNIEVDIYTSEYLDISNVNEDKFNNFVKNEWKNYNEYFLTYECKDTIIPISKDSKSSYENINIDYIKNNHLIEKDDWHDGMEVINNFIENTEMSFSLFNNINYPSVLLEDDNKMIAFNYLKDCLTIANEIQEEELSLLIFAFQKTNISINNKTKYRAFSMVIDKNGISPLDKENSKLLYIENHDNDSSNLIFMNAKENLNILNLNINLKSDFKY